MPYINGGRANLASGEAKPSSPGELNFVLTATVIEYMLQKGLNYQVINDILGALEGAKQEFYRRVAIPYENEAILRNGDVYPSLDELV